ncbi:MAG: prolipoprotein diacylglyceryl transferase, partial [Clostridia bacterium]|nr:prolipoprotein diacylglyceryl transferase [Clostridia bacterium]
VLYIICQKARKFSGQLALCYGVWYGAERAVVEGLRTDSLYIANTNIRVSQLLSAVLALVCLVLLIALTVKYTKHPKPIDGIDFFLEEELKKQKTAAAGEAPVSETPPADETAEEDNSNQGEV